MNTPVNDKTLLAAAAPEDVLIIVPVRDLVLFPGVVLPVAVHGARAVAAVQEAVRTHRRVGLLLQKDTAEGAAEPGADDLYQVGTAASIVRFITAGDGTHHVICQGEERFTVLDYASHDPFLVARIEPYREPALLDREVEARGLNLRERAMEALQLLPQAPAELANAIRSIESVATLADIVASFMDLKTPDKQDILATFDLRTRLDRVLGLLGRRIEVLKVSRQIDEKTRVAFDERQKEAVLRERLHQIQKELGETDRAGEELGDLKKAVADAKMPPEAEEQALRELARLERMPDSAAEYSMTRNYLDWLIAMPWSKADDEQVDIERARAILDEDHYGLDKVKRRILEFLAVRKLNPQGRSPILCFVGPPGVGKTSLGQSIAKALGLQFRRVSLGGVHDEAEIRGHRRTYIGSLPGNIAQAMRKAGRRNPVLMLDEVDKLSASHQGDPFSALLEVLDPEQNNTFRDNYLGVPFDLSKVLFIGTANVMDSIPGPLRDRMEVIELSGYTEEEKLQIARRYLVRRQLEANGLTAERVQISDGALRKVIVDYTREAGVRNLERQIGALLRNAAVSVASGQAADIAIDVADVARILGAPRYESDVALRTSVPGVATGLAWTPAGGDILFIESSRVKGSGKLILTGQLGDVMKESAQAAVTLVKSQAERLGVDPALLDNADLHIHVPNTHSVGVVRDATIQWRIAHGSADATGYWWSLPVVAETWDGWLNDINGFHVKPEHAIHALDTARGGPVEEGSVGGGTGMICNGYKGGIGTASRRLADSEGGYTVGVLVQCNYGRRQNLRIAGIPVGREIPAPEPYAYMPSDLAEHGSIIVVVATDAPLLAHQLKRLTHRVTLGLGRNGSISGNGSGDIFIAFSTANPGAAAAEHVVELTMLPNDSLDPVFQATVEATEEAIVNAMVAAADMTGADDHRVIALPHDALRDVLRKYGRLLP